MSIKVASYKRLLGRVESGVDVRWNKRTSSHIIMLYFSWIWYTDRISNRITDRFTDRLSKQTNNHTCYNIDYDMNSVTIVWEVGSCCLSLSWIWTEELSCLVGLYTPQVTMKNVRNVIICWFSCKYGYGFQILADFMQNIGFYG